MTIQELLRQPIFSLLQDRIYEALKKHGPMFRKELVNLLNMPRTTIYDNLIKLQKRNIVEKFSSNNGKKGRPLVFWKIVA